LLIRVKKPEIYKKNTSKVLSIHFYFVYLHHNKTIRTMEEAIKDIRDWAERYGEDVCLNRLLEILKDQWKIIDVKTLANELWEWNH